MQLNFIFYTVQKLPFLYIVSRETKKDKIFALNFTNIEKSA